MTEKPTMTDAEFIQSVTGLGNPAEVKTSIYEEICWACGGHGRTDAGYTEQYAPRDQPCPSCAGTGRVIVERERPC